jgi:hypothetical protein
MNTDATLIHIEHARLELKRALGGGDHATALVVLAHLLKVLDQLVGDLRGLAGDKEATSVPLLGIAKDSDPSDIRGDPLQNESDGAREPHPEITPEFQQESEQEAEPKSESFADKLKDLRITLTTKDKK